MTSPYSFNNPGNFDGYNAPRFANYSYEASSTASQNQGAYPGSFGQSTAPPPKYEQAIGSSAGHGTKVAPITDVSVPPQVGTYSVHVNSTAATGAEENIPVALTASFSNKVIRAAFIRKVYIILMLQLLTTVGLICLFIFSNQVKRFVKQSISVYVSAYVIFIVSYFTLVCCPSVRRKWPSNLICLIIFTLAMSYLTATISAFHETKLVLVTIGITLGVCLGITVFACQTKWDVTGWGIYIYVALWAFFLFGFIAIITYVTTGSDILYIVYSGGLALLLSLLLMYNTQQIIGGKKIEMSPEEYIYGALQLYMNIINIFLILLSIGGRK